MTPLRPPARPAVRLAGRAAAALAAAVLGLTVLTGCGSNTDCALDGCRITFQRDGGEAAVSVLGVQARLVGVEGGVATVEVAGNTVSLPVGEQQQLEGGLTIGVESVTDTEVVVRVSGG